MNRPGYRGLVKYRAAPETAPLFPLVILLTLTAHAFFAEGLAWAIIFGVVERPEDVPIRAYYIFAGTFAVVSAFLAWFVWPFFAALRRR